MNGDMHTNSKVHIEVMDQHQTKVYKTIQKSIIRINFKFHFHPQDHWCFFSRYAVTQRVTGEQKSKMAAAATKAGYGNVTIIGTDMSNNG